MKTMQTNQNAFQNAGQNGSFTYTAIGNQSSTFLVLILALIMLIALLRSERRNRELLQRLSTLQLP
jgi:predicted PurR-regulated permease PerM